MKIETLINEYGDYIFKYALKLTCHPQKAEDIAQETFIRAWKNLEQLQEDKAVKKWLRTICTNCFLMDYRKNVKKKIEYIKDLEILEQEGKLISLLPEPDEEVFVEESIKELQNGCFYAMVRKLTLKQRIAFSLIDMFGLHLEEVAEILEVSEMATKGLLYRARLNLDAFFSNHCNLLDSKNPCSCKAWIEFSKSREKNQLSTRNIIETLDQKAVNYKFDSIVRAKIHYLYSNMPDKKPNKEWYQNIILALK
ncbi:MAG: RNA polymerase sigma factor [Lachnotalea sp.]